MLTFLPKTASLCDAINLQDGQNSTVMANNNNFDKRRNVLRFYMPTD